jgi:soluble lytic murein transglycosylase-like protein
MRSKTPLATAALRPLVDALAQQVGLPPWNAFSPGEWLEALILQESGGNPAATRYEPHHDAASDPDRAGRDDGDAEDDKSYGLMQILGSNVRTLCGVPAGTPMKFAFLLRPEAGLAFGLHLLSDELRHTRGDVPRALARYNGGPTGERRGADGRLRRQAYVDGVAAWAAKVQSDRIVARSAR